VCGFSRCEKIKELFVKELAGKEVEYEKKWRENDYNKDKEFPGMSQWEVINEVTTALNIQNRGIDGIYTPEDSKYINLNTKNAYSLDDIFPLTVD
jgi:hypothetical protein